MTRQGVRARRFGPDTMLTVVAFLLCLATLHMGPQGADAWGLGGIALSVVLATALSQAATRPVVALAVITGTFLIAQASIGLVPVFALVVVVAVFRAASVDTVSRAVTVAMAAAAALAVDISAQLTAHDAWTDSAYVVMATTVLGSAAAGDAVRNRRAYVREVEDRARRAESTREQAMLRRVAEERLAIARDVHDLVAHHLAVITVHADVAGRLLGSRPEVASESIGLVRDAAGSALDELGSLIGVLRSGATVPLAPSPTLAQLPDLVASFETTGLRISRSEHGVARPLSAAVDLAAYRVVQESLTNAHKHGAGRADMHITYRTDELVIDIVNPTGSTAAAAIVGEGHGLVGMRERVAGVGGTVRVERSAPDRFRVLALLPATGNP